jgi:gliding motility-associated-like protein
LLPIEAYATHEVSGLITFKCIGGTTYQFTLTDYTNTYGTLADRDTMRMYWGDCTSSLLTRSNGPNVNGFFMGEPLCNYDSINSGNPVPEWGARKVNIYIGTHTFPGPGTYHVWIDDANRMMNMINMYESVNQNYYLFTTLIISPITGDSIQSAQITNLPCCQYGCANQCYYFNLGAYSPEGDSLSYSLGNCLQLVPGGLCGGYPIPCQDYFIPSGVSIDPVSGTITWCVPPVLSSPPPWIYNFSMRIASIKRLYYNGQYVVMPVDTVEVELEVIINNPCPPPPAVKKEDDTCVIAGTTMSKKYYAKDQSYLITLTASGDPFSVTPAATFSSNSPANGVTGTLNWTPDCGEVRTRPYEATVMATELWNIADSDYIMNYMSSKIRVIAPPPLNLRDSTRGSYVYLYWDKDYCSNITGYSIYRYAGLIDSCYTPGPCGTGIPASSGFVLIGTTNNWDSVHFVDSNGGRGLDPGVHYSYEVVANFPLPDGSVSIPSNCAHAEIFRTLPLITNVSVHATSSSSGKMYIRWTKPIAGDSIKDSLELDTNEYQRPYKFVLMRASPMTGFNFTAVDTINSNYFKSILDTTYMDTGLNTQNNSYNYRVDFYANQKYVGSSPTASSVYLSVKSSSRVLNLSWAYAVSWTDTLFYIYREKPDSTFFTYINKTKNTYYSDVGLANMKTYCYYIESVGKYDTTILHPLYDSSEIMCGIPEDTIPPCSPSFSVNAKCTLYQDSIIWNNPDRFCPQANQASGYQIYYTPTEGGEMTLVATITNPNDTVYVNTNLVSIAGCYAIVAMDSLNQTSGMGNIFCVDNCPQYQLPNVFTPNGGNNPDDIFTPILPYRYIQGIDIDIFNRWGTLMFHTTDPMINWTGNDQHSGQPCPDGVYYYICKVYEIRVTGIKTVPLKGYIELIR